MAEMSSAVPSKMPRVWIFVYHLPKGSSNKARVQFSHGLLGAKTTSHGGRYVFERRGILTDRPHVRPIKGVVLVGDADRDRVEKFLRSHDALVLMREVEPLREDLEALGLD